MRLIDADHLRRWILSRVFETQLSVADVIDQIDREDTIEPEPQWIPCNWHKDTENLPDECKSVLICIKDKIGTYVDVSYRTDYNRWERYGRNINVIAWMPLPEPWRGEEP